MGNLSAWRHERPVLVAEAQNLGAIGVIRSLGRGGYPVHACSRQEDALGLRSNYATAAVVCPPYESATFLDWLREYIARNRIALIIPSESFLLALRPVFDEFASLLPYGNDSSTVYAGMSKCDVFQRLTSAEGEKVDADDHLPPSLLLDSSDAFPDRAELSKLGLPLFLKVDASYSKCGEGGAVLKETSLDAAVARLTALRARYDKVLVQGYVPGQGVGVFFLGWNEQLVAQLMHHRLHEVPHDGGVSSLRESIWLPAIRDDAWTKFQQLRWQGVAMMEYRWDPQTDQFYFMEMNGRFWGSLHLALYAGVDFPLLLADAFFGRMPEPVTAFPTGVRCRQSFPGEFNYVWSRLKARNLPLAARLVPILEFIGLSISLDVHYDLYFPGDRKLYWINLRRFSRELFQSVLRPLKLRKDHHA